MNKKGLRGAILLGLLAVVFVVAGVWKVTGFFKNPEAEAMALLAQLPDKVSKSYEDEFLGLRALEKNSQEKGSAASIKISDIKVNKEASDRISSIVPSLRNAFMALKATEECTCSIDIASDEQQDIRKVTGSLSKGNVKLCADAYIEGDTVQYVLPEILPGKVIVQERHIFANMSRKQRQKKITEFLLSEYEKTKDDISCKKSRETAETYKFILSSKTLSIWINDFAGFVKKEPEFSGIINYIGKLDGQTGEKDGLSVLTALADQLSKETAEYQFCVKGSEGELTSVSFGTSSEEVVLPVMLTVSVSEKENDNTVKFTYERAENEGSSKWEITEQNKKSDVYEKTLDIVIQTAKTSLAVNTIQVIDSNDHSYNLETSIKWHGTKVAQLVMDGSVKDIVEGESIHYILDDISVNIGDEVVLTMAADVQKRVLDYKWEKPEGEEIRAAEITDELRMEMLFHATAKFWELGFDKLLTEDIIKKGDFGKSHDNEL